MEEVPLLKALHEKYQKDVVILGISVDTSVEPVDLVVKDKGMTWPILADGKGFDGPIPTAYHIQGTPELYVLDRAGTNRRAIVLGEGARVGGTAGARPAGALGKALTLSSGVSRFT